MAVGEERGPERSRVLALGMGKGLGLGQAGLGVPSQGFQLILAKAALAEAEELSSGYHPRSPTTDVSSS